MPYKLFYSLNFQPPPSYLYRLVAYSTPLFFMFPHIYQCILNLNPISLPLVFSVSIPTVSRSHKSSPSLQIHISRNHFHSPPKQLGNPHVTTILNRFQLHHYVDSKTSPPSKDSPEYKFWFSQDQFILRAFIGSTEPDVSQLSSSETSAKEWMQWLGVLQAILM